MSRIDSHIAGVRNKLALAEFLYAWAQALLVAAVVVLAYVMLRQFTLLMLPRETVILSVLLAATVVYGLIVGIFRRPGAMLTAVAIDNRLNLQEKFSTALHARHNSDPFSQAAVLDAERAAVDVDLHKKFPIVFPKPFVHALLVAGITAGLLMFVQPRNLFASDDPKPQPKKPEDVKANQQLQETVKKGLTAIEMAPKSVEEKENIQLAQGTLRELARSPHVDPATANRKALAALQDIEKAIKDSIEKNQKFAEAKLNERMLDKMEPGPEDKGPIADAQRELAKGNMGGAMEKLDETVKKFDQMTEDQKEKAADQMQKMANQLHKLASDPKQQQQMQQKLQQMGMNQQQAQQAMQAMQQAAQGNPQAQQQVQQMAQQAMQQMNNGAGATQAQQAQVQQMLQQMQGQANTQAQAQQMQQAAAAMAQAMQQAAAQQGQQGQQAGNQQGKQGQQGQQGQQANQGQNSQQNGQQGGGQTPQQQMAQANQQMQQQLQNMQAIAQDAQQVAAAQQAAQQAAADAANGAGQGQQGGNKPGDQGQGQGQGQGDNGQQANQKQGNGQGGAGIGRGGNMGMAESPFTVKQEVSKSKDIETGKIIAASLIKADAIKGESKADVKEVAASAMQHATDEIDSERVGRQGQKVVKDYFGALGEDAK